MAKTGLKWFRIDVVFDDKFELVCAEFGSKAFEVIVRLWQKIYESGYYCEWNEEVALLFAKKYSLGGNAVSEITKCAVKRGLFDKGLFDRFGILTSHGIQDWYFDSVDRRKSIEVVDDYLLINISQKLENVDIIHKNVNRNAENVSKNEHTTDTTDKHNKAGHREETAPSPSPKQHFGEFENVLLTDEEFQKLVGRFTAQGAAARIERLSTYLASSGKRYKNHYATILNWAQKDGASERKPEPKSLASKKAIFAKIAEEERNAINES